MGAGASGARAGHGPHDAVRQLVAGQERERRRIARDLHDVVGQALTTVRLDLERARRDPDADNLDANLRRSIAMVDQAMRDVRDIAFDIRPSILDDLGLVAAVRWYLERQSRIVGYRCVLQADGVRAHVGLEIESACFRTLQALLTNVARHAHASNVQVTLRQTPKALTLIVADDGVGFDAIERLHRPARHATLGLLGAAERVALVGGSFEIESRPGHGTRATAAFPQTVRSGERVDPT